MLQLSEGQKRGERQIPQAASAYAHAHANANANANNIGFGPQFYYNPLQRANPFAEYFEFIRAIDVPPEISIAADNVLGYLSSAQMDFSSIMANMQALRSLGPEDRLVGLLLRIQKELPVDCRARSDISKLILYNMMRSYLSYVPLLTGAFPNNFGIYHPTGDNVVNYRQIIKHLLAKLRCCEQKKVMHMPIPRQLPPKIEVRYLEKPTPPPQVVTEIRYVEKPCPTVVIPTTEMSTQSPYRDLIQIIPNPINGFEKMKHETIKNFLERNDIRRIVGDVDLSTAGTDQERFNLFLNKSATLQLEQPVIDAMKYYLNRAKTMGSLNLHTHKEIHKDFALTEIFTDTFDFEKLSLEGQKAFDALYSFLLEVTGEQMKNFSSWTEVNTRGEFTQIFFEYLLTQEFVPENIKQAITYLRPFIRMDGPGALPP